MNRWAILALLFAIRAGMGFQFEVVPALSPAFISVFQASVADIGFLLGLYQAPGLIFAFLGGVIGQRLGDRSGVNLGLVCMIIGALITTIAPNWSFQIAGRVIAGAGGILINVVMSKMVADWFAEKELASAMAIFINSWPVGIGFALLTLPHIAELGWRTAVFASALYPAVALIFFVLLYPHRPRRDHMSAATAGSIWPPASTLPPVLTSGLIWGLYNVAIATVLGFGPLMLVSRDWANSSATAATSAVLWVFAISVPLGGIVADQTGRRTSIVVAGLSGFAALLVLSARVEAVVLAFVALGLIGGLPAGPIYSLPGRIFSPHTRAMGMGMFLTVFYALQLVGPWFVGFTAQRLGNVAVAFDVAAVLLILACIAFISLKLILRNLPGGVQSTDL